MNNEVNNPVNHNLIKKKNNKNGKSIIKGDDLQNIKLSMDV